MELGTPVGGQGGVPYGLRKHISRRKFLTKLSIYQDYFKTLKGLAMIFADQENPFIIFRSKEINIYFKTNTKIPINLLK